MSENEYEIHESSSGASLSYPVQGSALRKNGHVLMKGRPCKIIDMSTSKTGKHGGAKVHLTGIDIFTGKKIEDICSSTHNMEVPNVGRNEYTLVNIEDGFMSLMDANGDMKDDIKVPEGELGEKMEADFEEGKELVVTIISAMNEEMCSAYKEAPNQ